MSNLPATITLPKEHKLEPTQAKNHARNHLHLPKVGDCSSLFLIFCLWVMKTSSGKIQSKIPLARITPLSVEIKEKVEKNTDEEWNIYVLECKTVKTDDTIFFI